MYIYIYIVYIIYIYIYSIYWLRFDIRYVFHQLKPASARSRTLTLSKWIEIAETFCQAAWKRHKKALYLSGFHTYK